MKNKNEKIAIVGTRGVPASYGGYETLAQNIACHGNDEINYLIIGSSTNLETPKAYLKARQIILPLNANGASAFLFDSLSVLVAWFHGYRKLLVLGNSAGAFLVLASFFLRLEIFLNTDGIEWKRNKWNWVARNFLLLNEKCIGHSRKIKLISDSKSIAKYYKDTYQKDSHFVPYGGDHLNIPDINKKPFNAINIARIVPENNIEIILSATSKVPEINLTILGDWKQGYANDLFLRYHKFSNIHFSESLYGKENEEKKNILRAESTLYLHGHSVGGTSPGLIESMFYSDFIFSYYNYSNCETLMGQGNFFKNEEELVSLLKDFVFEPHKLKKINREEACLQYSWTNIVQLYETIMVD